MGNMIDDHIEKNLRIQNIAFNKIILVIGRLDAIRKENKKLLLLYLSKASKINS